MTSAARSHQDLVQIREALLGQAFGTKHDTSPQHPQLAPMLLFDQWSGEELRMGLTDTCPGHERFYS
jgi:hypothetical protein